MGVWPTTRRRGGGMRSHHMHVRRAPCSRDAGGGRGLARQRVDRSAPVSAVAAWCMCIHTYVHPWEGHWRAAGGAMGECSSEVEEDVIAESGDGEWAGTRFADSGGICPEVEEEPWCLPGQFSGDSSLSSTRGLLAACKEWRVPHLLALHRRIGRGSLLAKCLGVNHAVRAFLHLRHCHCHQMDQQQAARRRRHDIGDPRQEALRHRRDG